ncbi:hypothetical protein TVNIR_0844 [Thioalkalivibrio nitratireducens DSM 14787]|uniref:Uncharacterized protein n=1 Tax=Thioalkalivibrio nitratireducens (strain DSM 14787 / UNIQEM 213 / ALEN2) TaxID=1255043 RepID=L0DSE6_THIND|nr:hypothetical protein TVNIR_0844 [Thioalkalivibrio nitratireducens DSM 14787]
MTTPLLLGPGLRARAHTPLACCGCQCTRPAALRHPETPCAGPARHAGSCAPRAPLHRGSGSSRHGRGYGHKCWTYSDRWPGA